MGKGGGAGGRTEGGRENFEQSEFLLYLAGSAECQQVADWEYGSVKTGEGGGVDF